MAWLSLLNLLLQLAVLVARRAERADIEKAVADEIEILHGRRVRAAVDARERVRDGRTAADPADPYRRD
ncbi:hypothetical protein [Tianweitania sediminis]|uniref:Uncharacterized protein n=1 Tax=Tianweitania sediminis TaxID=1502156 RepID=A0A8J7UJ21_9HYPH|nr:hypothetical protein [Tianweitania sediminis]MBP0438405.1 hypothetical protein [Tianweitania sediminis]